MVRVPAAALRQFVVASLAAVFLCLVAEPSMASRPVWRTIVGCVTDGVLISHDGYRIRVRDSRERTPVNLRRYDGRQIRISGHLLPGDLFFISTTPVVIGRCTRAGRGR